MGRNAIPKEVKLLKGTVNVTRERQRDEVMPETYVKTPPPPDDLGEIGVELWERVGGQLVALGIFYASLPDYLHALCRTKEIMEEAAADMARDGKYEVDPKTGRRLPSAAYKIFRETWKDFMDIGAKLGLSPADKTKISQSVAAVSTKDKNQIKRIGVTG